MTKINLQKLKNSSQEDYCIYEEDYQKYKPKHDQGNQYVEVVKRDKKKPDYSENRKVKRGEV